MIGIVLFGATGSIGTQTLEIIRNHQNDLKLIAFTYHKNLELANKIIDEFSPKVVGYSFDEDLDKIKKTNVLIKNSNIEKIIKTAKYIADMPIMFINALTGAAGLKPTYEILKNDYNCLLANKESLVLAGEIIMKTAAEHNVKIIPIDSEHSGLYRIIKNNQDEIDSLIITASGGALRDVAIRKLADIKAADALKHPNWTMGDVITINCATMVNKAYEVLEASYLFNIPISKINVLIHKESIVHALVKYYDGSMNANLGVTSMEVPIAYAINEEIKNLKTKELTIKNNLPKLELERFKDLHFDSLDNNRYPCFKYLLNMFEKGDYYPVVINAANEVAVNRYLNDEIRYSDIYKTIVNAVKCYDQYLMTKEPLTIDNIIKLDEEVRNYLTGKDVTKWIG